MHTNECNPAHKHTRVRTHAHTVHLDNLLIDIFKEIRMFIPMTKLRSILLLLIVLSSEQTA